MMNRLRRCAFDINLMSMKSRFSNRVLNLASRIAIGSFYVEHNICQMTCIAVGYGCRFNGMLSLCVGYDESLIREHDLIEKTI